MQDELDILDDAALARRWHKDKVEGITPEAIAKWLDRISDKKRANHLKSFKAGNKRLFRMEDVKAYEARAKNSNFDLATTDWSTMSDDELDELDPSFGIQEKPKWP